MTSNIPHILLIAIFSNTTLPERNHLNQCSKLGVTDGALDDNSTEATDDSLPGPGISGEQLLAANDVKPKGEKTMDDASIPIYQVLIRIRDRVAKLADIAPLNGNVTTKILHSDLLEVKKKMDPSYIPHKDVSNFEV